MNALGLIKICNSSETLGLRVRSFFQTLTSKIRTIQHQLKISGDYSKTVITPGHTRNVALFLVTLQPETLLGRCCIKHAF